MHKQTTQRLRKEFYSLAYNELPDSSKIPLLSFFNIANGNHSGLQLGFVNEVKESTNGIQMGFVNETRRNTKGLQFGFINETKGKVTGWLVGFLNVADTIENGVSVRFFSFVKKGGYRTVEVSTYELYLVNISFKTVFRCYIHLCKAVLTATIKMSLLWKRA